MVLNKQQHSLGGSSPLCAITSITNNISWKNYNVLLHYL